jgi:catechol 2,3-dioxygenase-like lactoylglutathione lyase family enzyme
MEPRLTVLTLAVDDLERAVAFYRDGCGLHTNGIIGREFEHGAVAFFDLQHGLKMALWERGNLAHDAGVLMQPRSSTEFSLGHNVRSEAEVDAVLVQAESAGVTIVKPAGKTFWGGYAGYFADLDGHLWEVVYNPNLLPE